MNLKKFENILEVLYNGVKQNMGMRNWWIFEFIYNLLHSVLDIATDPIASQNI